MTNTVYTLQLNTEQQQKLYQAWESFQAKAPAYAKWQLRPENCVITCYSSGKTVFQGKDAYIYAATFLGDVDEKKSNPQNSTYIPDILPAAGSDEVGTGDYFGPVCVVATIIDQDTDSLLHELGVRDSKQLNDKDICKIAPKLMQRIPYSLLILDNEKYNIVHAQNNMNAIKSKLHNKAYVNLLHRTGLPEFKVVDQFTPESSYYHYLKGEPIIVRGIHFETKAEDKYPAVGAASVIARYAFLRKMQEMEKEWDMTFAKGAGPAVDLCARQFVERYGKENLNKVAKIHFKNTERI